MAIDILAAFNDEQQPENKPILDLGVPDNEYRPTGAARYGNFYWAVSVPNSISDDGFIRLYADKAEVDGTGTLIFYQKREDGFHPTFGLTRSNYNYFFAASCIDSGAVCVQTWGSKQ